MSRPGTLAVLGFELRKLRAQKRTYLGLGTVVLIPLIFVTAVIVSGGGPEEIPFGAAVLESGLATPLVLLLFGSIWLFPLVTALVAGDIVASEDHNGTLSTILTRSVDRRQVFLAKVIAAFIYATLALALMGITALATGVLNAGFTPLPSLSGTPLSASRGLLLVIASFAVYLLPVLAIACIALLLSVLTRNSAASVVGTLIVSLLLQLIGVLPGLEGISPYLLTTQFSAWTGLLRTPVDMEPVVRAAIVCAFWAVPCVALAYRAFARRDVTGA